MNPLAIANAVGNQTGNGLFALLPYSPHALVATVQVFAVTTVVSSVFLVLATAARKRAHDALSQSEARFRTLAQNVQALEVLGSLAGGIAHDFNNVLMIICSYAEMLSLDPNPEHVRAKAERIVAAADCGADLAKRLISLSQRQALKPSVVHLDRLVNEVCEMVRPLVSGCIRIQIDSPADLWPVVSDRIQLEQVVLNLAINARDAMSGGGRLSLSTCNVQLHTSLKSYDGTIPAGDYVALMVEDSGCGMNAETQARMFDPFFTTKPAGKGSGLGLSTVYLIVKQLRGYLIVKSLEGSGTTFLIYLPRSLNAKDVPVNNSVRGVRSADRAKV